MADQEWRKLPEDDLWIKSSFSSESYNVLVTDMCHLYAEELDADDLRWRATKAKLPVDIDIDEAQNASIFLKNLSAALDSNNFDALNLANKSRSMDISTTVSLPKPLKDCQWIFKLELQDDDRFRSVVAQPLLGRVDTLRSQQEDLIHRLQDKDHVIEKLLDMIDKYSVDLAEVFPTLASHSTTRRTHTRRDVETHIPALQVFEEMAWRKAVESGKRYESTRPTSKPEETFELPESPESSRHAAVELDVAPMKNNNKPAKGGIKRRLGNRKQPSPEPMPKEDAATESESTVAEEDPKVSSPPPRMTGIKRTLGRPKTVGNHVTPEPTPDPTPEIVKTPPRTSKGVKRTLGGRKHDAESAGDATLPDRTSPMKGADQEAKSHNPDKPSSLVTPDDDEIADQKRAALKKQFATAADHKPKKRRF